MDGAGRTCANCQAASSLCWSTLFPVHTLPSAAGRAAAVGACDGHSLSSCLVGVLHVLVLRTAQHGRCAVYECLSLSANGGGSLLQCVSTLAVHWRCPCSVTIIAVTGKAALLFSLQLQVQLSAGEVPC